MDALRAAHRLVVPNAANAADLDADIAWFVDVADNRLQTYFPGEQPGEQSGQQNSEQQRLHFYFDRQPPPDLSRSDSAYANLIKDLGLVPEERLILVLALLPYVRPQLLDIFFSKNPNTERGYTEFGGLQGHSHSGFLPTVETALFLLAGEHLELRIAAMRFIETGATLFTANVVQQVSHNPSEPWTSNALAMSREFVDHLTTGAEFRPAFSENFPARRISTPLQWEHLVLPAGVLEQLEEIKHWVRHGNTLMHEWNMLGKLNPGFTSLFYGPPGTGKTLSACLLGNYCQRDVYKIDLSLMVSKFIGETEKNLARIFDTAHNRDWILFFDEADALFGKRTKVDNSHDRYANQEVSYLLQRIEEFDGVVILASNLKSNIDDAFIRRFQSVVQFPLPSAAERLRIWRNAFSEKVSFEPGLQLQHIADKYEAAGGTIMNVVRFCSLRALSRRSTVILKDDVEEGLRREFNKEGRRL